MSRAARVGRWCAAASVAILMGACGSGSAPDPALAGVVLAGGADAPALEQLLASTPSADTTKGVVIDYPATDTILDAATIVTFRWHPPTPMSGAGYFLVFATDVSPELLRVFTTETSYTPDAKAWKTLGAAMIWTKLSIVSAAFQDDEIVPGEGPFEGDPVLFCIDKKTGASSGG